MNQSQINRRGFLGTMGAAATGLALATNATALTQATNGSSPATGSNPDVLTRTLPRTGERVTAAATLHALCSCALQSQSRANR